jgi:hypothetical protein
MQILPEACKTFFIVQGSSLHPPGISSQAQGSLDGGQRLVSVGQEDEHGEG